MADIQRKTTTRRHARLSAPRPRSCSSPWLLAALVLAALLIACSDDDGGRELDWDARQLLSVFSTGAGNKVSELDLAGSNPSYFDRFGPALWPQCEQIDVHIWVDPTIEPALRASARSLTVNTVLALNELTGLQFVVRSGSSEQDEQFFDAAIVPAVPGIRELGLYWYNTASDQPSAQFGLADIWHSNPVELDRVLSDGSVSVTAKDTPTKQASLLRTRVGLSIGILRELPDTHITERSQAMAVLHELAHVVGVGHSTDRESFMYPRFNDDTRPRPSVGIDLEAERPQNPCCAGLSAGRAGEIRTPDLRSPRSLNPKPLTCANVPKRALACGSG